MFDERDHVAANRRNSGFQAAGEIDTEVQLHVVLVRECDCRDRVFLVLLEGVVEVSFGRVLDLFCLVGVVDLNFNNPASRSAWFKRSRTFEVGPNP